MRISGLAKRTGLSAHTIRYYERIGLLPPPARNPARQRYYDASVLDWIAFLKRLKTTGMPLRDMRAYARLRGDPATAPERAALLAKHREAVSARIAELTACLAVLDEKIASYGGSPLMTETGHDHHDRDRKRTLRKRKAQAA